ncbi:Protein-lysine N-methyltransferase efm4 [Dispira parvispora]|uniref:Protein-lysine N-methyltransferase efm4 n=1 Tax=Dispira parvispora TaxID=1520584 RepID=A0A9W8AQ33_9FUNG|nr:Protein-lysine N-methyltransferase efm4 [Dispira parvispora]
MVSHDKNVTSEVSSVPETKPHHRPKGGFMNPWSSYQEPNLWSVVKTLALDFNFKTFLGTPSKDALVPVQPVAFDQLHQPNPEAFQLTWLGHASFLLQTNGLNILFDPVFSNRCSPFQFIGPARIRPTPCRIDELPPIDIVMISHNHYDHMDKNTIKALGTTPQYFVPLGNKSLLKSLGATRVTEMDWWDEQEVDLATDESNQNQNQDHINDQHYRRIKVACTPCQHHSNRGVLDRCRSLWASFTLILPQGPRFFFSGDTGYRSVQNTQQVQMLDTPDDKVPACPVFKEIGAKYGPFNLACLPIGAYSPRWLFSPMHCSPEDAVRIHEDIRSTKSIGMHWGTFILTDEDVSEPPVRLANAMENRGHHPEAFTTMNIGATLTIPMADS